MSGELSSREVEAGDDEDSVSQSWLRVASRAGSAFSHRRSSPLAHNALNLALFTFLVAVAAASIRYVAVAPSVAHVVIGGVIIGWTGFALMILVVHEASHGMFLLAQDDDQRRRANRVFGWIVAIPFAVNYRTHWEEGHIVHHRHPLELHDPQQFNCLTGYALAGRLALYLLVPGGMFVHRFLGKRARAGAITRGGVLLWTLLFWSSVLAPLGVIGGIAPTLAVLFGLNLLAAVNELKGSLEHGGALRAETDFRFRSRSSLFFGRHLLMPFNISLHFEHHLNPAVPWYRLGRYHSEIESLVPADLRPLLFSERPIAQLAGVLPGPSAAGVPTAPRAAGVHVVTR